MNGDALDRVLREVSRARLRPDDWDEVHRRLQAVEAGAGSIDELTTVLFEAQVRGRFQGNRAGADVVPTKQTSVLPLVGLACGAFLFGIGALLGGGVILVGIAVLGVFVFGVAFAGSRVAHRDRGDSDAEDDVVAVSMPPETATLVASLRRP